MNIFYPVFTSSKVTYGALITFGVIFCANFVLVCEYANGSLCEAICYKDITATALNKILQHNTVTAYFTNFEVGDVGNRSDLELLTGDGLIVTEPISLPLQKGGYVNFGPDGHTTSDTAESRVVLPYTVYL